MAYWKPSFASLSTYFTRESEPNKFVEHITENTETIQTKTEAHAKSPLSADMQEKLGVMVHDIWEDVFTHVCKSHPRIVEDIFAAVAVDEENKLEVKVLKEVFKREIVIALEHTHGSRMKPDIKKSCSEPSEDENVSMNSLKQSLREMSEKAEDAEQALKVALGERHHLECVCQEYEEEQQKISEILQNAREENENLRKNTESLEKGTKQLKAAMKELQDAKRVEQMKALRSQHDAEMAHLIAKQSVLQAKLMDRQLKEAESSSEMVQKRVEELQKVQSEIRNALENSSHTSVSHAARVQTDSPVQKNSRLPREFGTALFLRKRKADSAVGGARRTGNGTGADRAQGAREQTERLPPSNVLKHFRRSTSNRNGGETRPRVQHHFVRQRQNEANRERATLADHEERGRILNRLRNFARGARGHTNHEVEAAQGIRDRIPWIAKLTRALSPITLSHGQHIHTTIDVSSQTLDALGKNLEALHDVVDKKQKEVDQLRRELLAAKQQSDTLEQRLRKEQHKNVEMKHKSSGDDGGALIDLESRALRTD